MQMDGEVAQGTKYKETIGKIQRLLHSWWKKGVAEPISNIDQEADHWANMGAQGRRKIVIDRREESTVWKATRGLWDGSFKDNGRSGCGIVVKGVDREKWVTITKIALPLKASATMAAEVVGVCVLTSAI